MTNKATRELRAYLIKTVADLRPCTVRQVYYAATVDKQTDKTDAGYGRVQRQLKILRELGLIKEDAIVDRSRAVARPGMYNSIGDLLRIDALVYRSNWWRNEMDVQVLVFLEKDALRGVIEPVTREYGVSLWVARGYSSRTFLHEAARSLDRRKPAYIYHLGDFDPSGLDARRAIKEGIDKFVAEGMEIYFRPLALTKEQLPRLDQLGLGRPTKVPVYDARGKLVSGDPRTPAFFAEYGQGHESYELDALNPRDLRRILHEALGQHMTAADMRAWEEHDEGERDKLREIAEQHGGSETDDDEYEIDDDDGDED